MNKRVLSILLSAVILFTCTAIPTLADTAPKEPDVLLAALGIIDSDISEKVSAGENIKRADAAYYALKVSGHSDIPAFSGSKFADVSETVSRADAINYCVDLGIAAQDTYFRPDDDVTLAEFIKMIEAGLGYTGAANIMGGYPDGYIKLAKSLGIIDGIPGAAGSAIGYQYLEKLLANVLTSSYIDITNISSTETYQSGSTNVLYEVFHVYKVTGMITANAVTTLTVPVGVGTNSIKIEDDLFKVEPKLYPQIAKKLGYTVNAWVREESYSSNELLICYEERQTMTVEDIHAEDFKGITGGTLSYYSGTRLKKVTLPVSCKYIYNGRAAEAEISGDVFNNRWGNVLLLKPDGSKVSMVVITAYDDYFVSGVDKTDFVCYDNTAKNKSISFKDGSDLSEYAYFSDNAGNILSFDSITANCVISVAQNGNSYDCIIVNESFSGVLESISTDNDELTEIYVNSNHYKLAPEMDNSRAMNLKTGNSYRYYLDGDGRVAAAILETSTGKSMNWVYLLGINESDEDDCLYFRVLTSANERVSIKSADKIKIDGISYKDYNRSDIRRLFTQSDESIMCQPIKVEVDTSGSLINVDTINHNANENQNDAARRFYNDEIDPLYFKRHLSAFGMAVKYDNSTTVFITPSGTEKEEYSAGGVDVFTTDIKYHISAYNSDIYSRTAEVIVCTDNMALSTPMWMQEYLTVVTNVQTVSEDNEVITVLTGYQKGVEGKWTVENEDVLKIIAGSNGSYLSNQNGKIKVGKGDAIRFATNKDGEISSIQLIYDCSEREYHQPTTISGEVYDGIVQIGRGYQRMQIGMVYPYRALDNALISATDITREPDDKSQNYIVTGLAPFKVYIVDASGTTASVKVGTAADVKDWYNFGQDKNMDVLMKCRYDEGRDLVIYKYE